MFRQWIGASSQRAPTAWLQVQRRMIVSGLRPRLERTGSRRAQPRWIALPSSPLRRPLVTGLRPPRRLLLCPTTSGRGRLVMLTEATPRVVCRQLQRQRGSLRRTLLTRPRLPVRHPHFQGSCRPIRSTRPRLLVRRPHSHPRSCQPVIRLSGVVRRLARMLSRVLRLPPLDRTIRFLRFPCQQVRRLLSPRRLLLVHRLCRPRGHFRSVRQE